VDHTGHDWLTAFQEVGTDIMGMTADELKALQDRADANSNPEFDAVVQARLVLSHQASIYKRELDNCNSNPCHRPL